MKMASNGRKEMKKDAAAVRSWVQRPGNIARLAVMAVVFAALIGFGIWVNQPEEGAIPTSASQLVYDKAVVTAVLEDDAAPDYEYAEGRRVGTQELEIRLLTGVHEDEIMPLCLTTIGGGFWAFLC